MQANNVLDLVRKVIDIEVDSLRAMKLRINEDFQSAIDIVLASRGRVVVVGMGKSGIIGQKIAATLASTGTPSFFVHPGEAFHGDLGMIKPIDVALLISNSGETEEVIRLLPFLQYQNNKIIAITGRVESTLGSNSDVVLDVSVAKEACTNNLAPTSSTTATLVMGDALAVTLADVRGFKPEDFALFHPGGSLGKKLLTKVSDVMRKDGLPVCSSAANFRDIVHAINQGRLGLVLIKDENKLSGIITDGDLRRTLDNTSDYAAITASTIMTHQPKTINSSVRIADAEELMRKNKINALVAVNDNGDVVGVLQIYDLDKG